MSHFVPDRDALVWVRDKLLKGSCVALAWQSAVRWGTKRVGLDFFKFSLAIAEDTGYITGAPPVRGACYMRFILPT